jgi:hypothetical protein
VILPRALCVSQLVFDRYVSSPNPDYASSTLTKRLIVYQYISVSRDREDAQMRQNLLVLVHRARTTTLLAPTNKNASLFNYREYRELVDL